MAVYSLRESGINMDSIESIPCKYDNMLEASYAIIAESEANYANIMKAVGIAELAVFEESGQEMIYEAADVKGFFGKVKDFFVNLMKKVKGLFEKFFAMINSYAKTDKEFVNKYRKQLLTVNTKDFSFKGFKFKIKECLANKLSIDNCNNRGLEFLNGKAKGKVTFGDSTASITSNDKTELENIIKAVEDSDFNDYLRAAMIESNSSLTASEFSKEIFEMLRDGEDSKVEIEDVNVSSLLSDILSTKETKKNADKAFKEINDSIKKKIKMTEALEKDLLKGVGTKTDNKNASKADQENILSLQIRVASKATQCLKDEQMLLQTINGQILQAIKQQNRQAKSVCVSLLNYKPKNEGFGYDEYEGLDDIIGENFLSGVKLV